MTKILQFPNRCEADVDVGERCKSRNTVWSDSAQKNLCVVHEAAHQQRLVAKQRHPAGKKS